MRLEHFFRHGDGNVCAGIRAPDDAKPSVQEDEDIPDRGVLYIHGPADSGQTSLLLQYGFTQVQTGKGVALVLRGDSGASQQPAADSIVPLIPCAKCDQPVQTGEDNAIWQQIHIKYLKTSTELQHFLCSLHVVAKQTSVLIIDSFEQFFPDQTDMGSVYQTMAYLLDAREYMESSTGFGAVVVVGKTDAFFLRDRLRLRRWCKFLEIRPDKEPEVFTLREETEDNVTVADSQQTQIQYQFSPAEENGVFQLLHVRRGDDG